MRDALKLTEDNLGSLIAARVNMASGALAMERLMIGWRDVVRRALSDWAEHDECICPNCGVRHGGRSVPGVNF